MSLFSSSSNVDGDAPILNVATISVTHLNLSTNGDEQLMLLICSSFMLIAILWKHQLPLLLVFMFLTPMYTKFLIVIKNRKYIFINGWKNLSAKVLAQDFSNILFSCSVRLKVLSKSVSCWLSFFTKDIRITSKYDTYILPNIPMFLHIVLSFQGTNLYQRLLTFWHPNPIK